MACTKEHCLICGTLNELNEPEKAEAWECYNCRTRYWIDDQCRLEYMVRTGVRFKDAEHALKLGEPIFC